MVSDEQFFEHLYNEYEIRDLDLEDLIEIWDKLEPEVKLFFSSFYMAPRQNTIVQDMVAVNYSFKDFKFNKKLKGVIDG